MLKVLPSYISNLIAAGEVVQRPSSVVKELMENAVDAGATNIVVIINDSGRTLIQVIDNGCGMSAKDAALSFERHATSKIEKAEDLYSIETYGFRGEALASIAACANVTLKTRKEGEESGTEINISESKITSQNETSCPVGCNFAVRNIFYNIPARRKFLKSDNVEYRQIVNEFIRVALTRLDIEFRLIHNSKDIFVVPVAQNTKQRITQLSGKEIVKDLIDIQTDTNLVKITGFVGRPEFSKKNQPNQFLFVNGRFFKSPLLHKAILKAYGNLIPDSTSPSYFIYLTIDPKNMDINIHPTKTEIKFESDSAIFEIVSACVREAIGGNSFVPSIDFDTEGAPEIPIIKTGFNGERQYYPPPKINYDPLFNPFDEEKKTNSQSNNIPSYNNSTTSYEQEKANIKGYGSFFNEEENSANPIIVLKGKYILTTVKSGLMLIDIARAKERILYERYLTSITHSSLTIQEHLFPETIDLDHNSYNILMEDKQLLKKLGFDIRPFGKDCVVVYGTPATFADSNLSINECIDSLISDLTEIGKDFEQEAREKIALNMIKHVGINKSSFIGNVQAQEIIDSLFACSEPNYSPKGGATIAIISVEELTKKLL
jgi:DNA mismatch repair protein MutL